MSLSGVPYSGLTGDIKEDTKRGLIMKKFDKVSEKDIPGYEGLYKINQLGVVKSVEQRCWMPLNNCFQVRKEKIKIPFITNNGYSRIELTKNKKKKKFLVHQLVAMAFLNHTIDGLIKVVDHIDRNRLNNSLENLQVISQRENCTKDKKGLVGAYFSTVSNKWRACIVVEGKSKHLGVFKTEIEAHQIYLKAVVSIELSNPIQTIRTTGYSSHKGISYNKNRKKWIAYTTLKNKQKQIGSFNTETEALEAKNKTINHGR